MCVLERKKMFEWKSCNHSLTVNLELLQIPCGKRVDNSRYSDNKSPQTTDLFMNQNEKRVARMYEKSLSTLCVALG